MLQGVIVKEFANVALKYAFVLEGQHRDELPERMLGGCFIARAVLKDVALKLSTKGDTIGEIIP